jgi:hypothetical protein
MRSAESLTTLLEAAQGGQVAIESTPFGIDQTHSIYSRAKKARAAGRVSFSSGGGRDRIGSRVHDSPRDERKNGSFCSREKR